MKNLYNKVSLFSVLALVAFQNLQATSNLPIETANSQRPIKSLTSRSSDLLQDTLQKLKNDQYIPDSSFEHLMNTSFEEIKQLRSTMTPDHEMFDAWIRLILQTFSNRPDFEDVLKVAKLKGESEAATPMAQYNLGTMYQFGGGVDTDLAQSLNWFLKCYKNRSINPLLKHRIQNLVNYTPITLSLNDEKHHLKNQETLKNNIEAFLERHGLEKLINTSYESEKGTNELTSSFKESKFAIPSLVKKYQKIVNFEDILLKSISAFDHLGFMVTCLQPDDIEAFKSSNCPDIKYYELEGESFLTFGQDNIEAADKLKTIFKSQPVYRTIYDVLSVIKEIRKNFQTEIEMSDVAQALKTQYEFRIKLDLDKTLESDKTSDLTLNKKLIEKVEQDIEVLKQLQAVPQLIDLLIEGVPVRNRIFLQNNDYIEPIFKD